MEHAGWSYTPGRETKRQGRARGARSLAQAEAHARDAGWFYRWEIDPDSTSKDFNDEKPAWQLWQCALFSADHRTLGSLCGIDFGRDGEPWGQSYKRVVEAELAQEAKP
jgi:hypothetical protein